MEKMNLKAGVSIKYRGNRETMRRRTGSDHGCDDDNQNLGGSFRLARFGKGFVAAEEECRGMLEKSFPIASLVCDVKTLPLADPGTCWEGNSKLEVEAEVESSFADGDRAEKLEKLLLGL